MKTMRKMGVIMLIIMMTFPGWIEIIYAEGFKLVSNLNVSEEVSLGDNIDDELKIIDDSLEDDADEVVTDDNSSDNLNDESKGENLKTGSSALSHKANAFNVTSQPRKHLLAGYDYSGVIMENGDVWTWGANESYQLGLGDNENRLYPVRQNSNFNPRDIAEVISTDGTTHILLNNGDVYRWGKSSPAQGGLSKPTRIARNVSSVGHARVQALTNPHDATAFVENGQVKVYGSSYHGQAGRGISGYGASENCTATYNINIGDRKPVLTSGTVKPCPNNSSWKTVENGVPLTNVRMVEGSTSTRGFVAVTNDNEIYTWGQGYSNFARKNNNVSIDDKIIKLAVGSKIYALTEKGDVWEWSGVSGTPIKINIPNVKDVQAQADTVMILTENGDVYGRGNNSDGQLGANLGSSVSEFTKIRENIKEIGLGLHHSLFEDNNGKIFGQGWNGYRQLANENDGVKERFTKVNSLSNITHVSAEIYSSFIIENNRNLLGWGDLGGGDLGGRTNSPRRIKTFDTNVVKLDSNTEETTTLTGVLLDNNRIYVWGHDYDNYNGHTAGRYVIGELKHNPNNSAYTPNTVDGKTYVVKDKIGTSNDDLLLKDFVAGGYGGTAINMKGELLSWGSNSGGMWGIGENHLEAAGSRGIISKTTNAFVKAKSDEKFIKVAGNSITRIALQEGGNVYSWGHDRNGSLARSGSTYLPMRINGLNNIEKISMGNSTGMALDNKGNLYSWGANEKGQVGDGTVSSSKGIVNISGLSGVTFKDIFSGRTSQFAITKNGDLYAWGDNRYGQLGLGGRFNRTSPRKVEGLPGPVKQVANGKEHTIVLLENGDVYVAGADTFGQLGLGAQRSRIAYQEIPFPDYITLNTQDNIEKNIGDTFTIDGYVTSIIPGNPLEIKYEIESPAGIVERGKIKDTTSTLSSNPFTKTINLDSKYTIGGYTINVTVVNKASGMENTQTINFGVIDNIPPSSPKVNVSNSNWTNKDVNVSIVEGVDNESGVDYTEYRINNGNWIKYEGPFVISDEGEKKIDSRTVDKAGNRSSIASETVRIDKTAPSVIVTSNITEDTHKNVILNVNASDNLSGIKTITYLGENMIRNGDFKEGLKYWDEDKTDQNPIGGGDIAIRNGYLYLGDNRTSQNKAEQRDAFSDTTVGSKFYAIIEARGKGILNARYAVKYGEQQTNYAQELLSETDFNQYKFGITRGDNARDVFMVERRSKEGWVEIRNIEVYAEKDITDTRQLEVTGNGKYSFVVEDNAGNITVESFVVDNIVRELTFETPKVIDDVEVEINSEMTTGVSIDNVTVTDWRDEINDWKLTLSASQLQSNSHMLPKGTLEFAGINKVNKVDGNKSGNMNTLKDYRVIDDGEIEIVNANNERGIYEIEFKDEALKFNLSPTTVKKGTYNTTLTWTLKSTPQGN